MKTLKEIRENLNKMLDEIEHHQEPKKEWSPDDLEGGDDYWIVSVTGDVIKQIYNSDLFDQYKKLTGDMFETKEDAQYHLDMLKLSKSIRDQGFKPDWGNAKQPKWFAYYAHQYNRIDFNYYYRYERHTTHFETKEKAKATFEDVWEADFLYMLRKGMI